MTIEVPSTTLSTSHSSCAVPKVRAPHRPKARHKGRDVFSRTRAHTGLWKHLQHTGAISPLLSNIYILNFMTFILLEAGKCDQLGKCPVLCLVAQSCLTLCDSIDCRPPGSSVHGDSPGKNTEVGYHALLQEIVPNQGANPGLSHCRQILYCLSHHGSPRVLEWVAHPCSRGSSWPRKRSRVSCIAGRFFISWATRAAPKCSG